jgi:hypothetical protein
MFIYIPSAFRKRRFVRRGDQLAIAHAGPPILGSALDGHRPLKFQALPRSACLDCCCRAGVQHRRGASARSLTWAAVTLRLHARACAPVQLRSAGLIVRWLVCSSMADVSTSLSSFRSAPVGDPPLSYSARKFPVPTAFPPGTYRWVSSTVL